MLSRAQELVAVARRHAEELLALGVISPTVSFGHGLSRELVAELAALTGGRLSTVPPQCGRVFDHILFGYVAGAQVVAISEPYGVSEEAVSP